MIIKRFFKVKSNKIVIFKVNLKLWYEKFRVFVTFYKNLHTRLKSRVKKTLAPASAKSCCSTGFGSSSGSATLLTAHPPPFAAASMKKVALEGTGLPVYFLTA
jgi:hypothetical protein